MDGDVQRPFAMDMGPGAYEPGLPGFFAANNFFNADPDSMTFNGWWSNGQMRYPDRSMYLVDSVAGEVIEDSCDVGECTGCNPWNNDPTPPDPASTLEVDFRYGDLCLMLFIDGHVEPQSRWDTLDDLQQPEANRNIRVQNLDLKATPGVCP